jgi:hypothetical protein
MSRLTSRLTSARDGAATSIVNVPSGHYLVIFSHVRNFVTVLFDIYLIQFLFVRESYLFALDSSCLYESRVEWLGLVLVVIPRESRGAPRTDSPFASRVPTYVGRVPREHGH